MSFNVWQRIAAVCGILFVGLLIASIIVEPAPGPGASNATLRSFYAHNVEATSMFAALNVFSACAFLVFLAGLTAILRRAAGEMSVAPTLALGAGIAWASTVAVTSSIPAALASHVAGRGDVGSIGALNDLYSALTALVTAPLALALLTSSVVMLATRIVPRWLSFLGLLSGVAVLVNTLSVSDRAGAFAGIAFVGLNLSLVWVLAVSVVLLRRTSHETEPAPATSSVHTEAAV